MDYLDTKKQFRHRIIILVGYVCVAIAIVIATLVLLYQAYGFGLDKNGTVIQNSLAFFSSQPHPANIYVNGVLNKAKTNTRLVLPSGIYHISLSRDGYQDWQRTIELDGGNVEHFDYPFLFPKSLTTKKVQTYTAAPGLEAQSPDRRWLFVEQPGSMTDFQVYDLKSPTKAPADLNLPATVLTKATSSENWQLEEWASDNKHLVLQHNYDGKVEFILIDRTDPAQARNLNTILSANPPNLTLSDKKYDHYYLYGVSPGLLQAASLDAPTPQTVLEHVLTYQSYGANTLLYATDSDAPSTAVLVKLRSGDKTYTIRKFPAGTTYLLDLTKYSDTLYAAAGASSENKTYIYKDPISQLSKLPNHALVPAQVLHVTSPNYLSFSTNAQFIAVQNAAQFGVYDIENTKGYNYIVNRSPDTGVPHATWMDGDRLLYVSQGKLVVFDYDGTNVQTLVSASSAYQPAFAPDYHTLFAISPASQAGQFELTQTFLLAPADR